MYDVSVIIPVYNSRLFIAGAIDSVLAQTCPAAEIIVVDDGSQDGTADEVVRLYADRVRLLQQTNSGPSVARNAGIAVARANWIAFLDADDVWMPEKLELQIRALRQDPKAVMAVAGCFKTAPGGRVISENKLPEPLDQRTIRRELARRTLFPMNGVVARREALNRVGGFDATLRCGEDRDLWIRLAASGKIVAVHKPLARQLTHQASLSSDPEVTLRDGLIVNRRALQALAEPGAGRLSQALRLRSVDAKLYYSVAWLYAWRNRRRDALKALLRSWTLWPWASERSLKRQAGFLLELLRRSPMEF